MPSKNRLKIYVSDSYYHVYNRGVAKNKIFKGAQDYNVYIKYISEALSKPVFKKVEFSLRGQTFKAEPRPIKNFKNEIELIAYCLMPNHFHFLLKQIDKHSMQEFMRSINTRYSSYFNRKYNRVGPLFQGRYKAVLVKRDEYLLYLSKYIHQNSSELGTDLVKAYSSYSDYLHLRKTKWLTPDVVLKFFDKKLSSVYKKSNTYKSFVEGKGSIDSQLPSEILID